MNSNHPKTITLPGKSDDSPIILDQYLSKNPGLENHVVLMIPGFGAQKSRDGKGPFEHIAQNVGCDAVILNNPEAGELITIERLVQNVRESIEHLIKQYDNIHILGSSLGGLTGILAALPQYDAFIDSVILWASPLCNLPNIDRICQKKGEIYTVPAPNGLQIPVHKSTIDFMQHSIEGAVLRRLERSRSFSGKIVLYAGENDPLIPHSGILQMKKSLDDIGIPLELVSLEHGHDVHNASGVREDTLLQIQWAIQGTNSNTSFRERTLALKSTSLES
ncbi:MAG: alpha/beta hydrolase [Candidatus Peregrinibacteria bacterium]